MKKILLLLLIVGGWKLYNHESQVSTGPGVTVSEEPLQKVIVLPVSHSVDNYIVNEISTFNIKAKVLSREDYSFGREADLSPTDLALGWGRMSDESILDQIKITQSSRFYYWRVESFPIPRQEIESHSANMHLIPASDTVKSMISKVRNGDIIEMSGSLVNVNSIDGTWFWKSSQTRNDTGKGACELIWVKNIRIITH